MNTQDEVNGGLETGAMDASSASLQCVRCGYDLHGLSDDAKCPECGTSVERSHHNLLRDAEPNWLRLLHRGMKVAYFGLRSFILLVLLYFFVMLGLGVFDVLLEVAEDVLEILTNAMLTLFVVAIIAALVTMGLGAWLISTPELRETDAGWQSNAYRVLGAMVVPAVGLWMAFAGPFVTAHPVIQQLVVHVCFAVLVAHGWMMIHHTRALEQRLPHPRTGEQQSRTARPRAFPIGVAIVFALYWLLPTFFPAGPPGWRPPGEQAQAFLLFITLIMWFALLGSLVTLRHRIAKEREVLRDREGERVAAQPL